MECPSLQYVYYGTCVDQCPWDLPFVMHHSMCVKQCGVGQYIEASRFCTDVSDVGPPLYDSSEHGVLVQDQYVCPEGTLYTDRYPGGCSPVLYIGLALGAMTLFLLGFLLCCAWFYRIHCGVRARLASCCRHTVVRRNASYERAALVDNDGEETSVSHVV